MDSKKHIFRHIESYAFDENLIGRHMVFIAGPRQTGKTWLAKPTGQIVAFSNPLLALPVFGIHGLLLTRSTNVTFGGIFSKGHMIYSEKSSGF